MKQRHPDFEYRYLTRFYLPEVEVRPLLASWPKIVTQVVARLEESTKNEATISHCRLRGSSASTSFVVVDNEKFSSIVRLLDSPTSPLESRNSRPVYIFYAPDRQTLYSILYTL